MRPLTSLSLLPRGIPLSPLDINFHIPHPPTVPLNQSQALLRSVVLANRGIYELAITREDAHLEMHTTGLPEVEICCDGHTHPLGDYSKRNFAPSLTDIRILESDFIVSPAGILTYSRSTIESLPPSFFSLTETVPQIPGVPYKLYAYSLLSECGQHDVAGFIALMRKIGITMEFVPFSPHLTGVVSLPRQMELLGNLDIRNWKIPQSMSDKMASLYEGLSGKIPSVWKDSIGEDDKASLEEQLKEFNKDNIPVDLLINAFLSGFDEDFLESCDELGQMVSRREASPKDYAVIMLKSRCHYALAKQCNQYDTYSNSLIKGLVKSELSGLDNCIEYGLCFDYSKESPFNAALISKTEAFMRRIFYRTFGFSFGEIIVL